MMEAIFVLLGIVFSGMGVIALIVITIDKVTDLSIEKEIEKEVKREQFIIDLATQIRIELRDKGD